ncbi:MAG TPA: tetratricopeptide repeat protein [Thermoguttaceae bacterium]|nr:tetratricopeptide repeat protein [Thermoguttaceae bacterium]
MASLAGRSVRRQGLAWRAICIARIGIVLGMVGGLLVGCGGGGGKGASASAPPSPDAREAFNKGKSLINSDRAAAIAAFTEAIQAAPQFQQAYVWRGVAYQEDGQRENAVKDFSKAIELDPTDNYALEQRAALYRRMGQSDKAQADEDRAAQLREKNREQIRKNVEDAKNAKKRKKRS